jgi:plastocyanin
MNRRICLLAASLFLSACGGGSSGTKETTGSTSPAATTKTIVVEETEFQMKPSVSRVKLGTYVFKGVNKGTIPHVLELEGPGLENETGTIAPGKSESVELILRNPGKYELYCPLDEHKKKGMKATFFVER